MKKILFAFAIIGTISFFTSCTSEPETFEETTTNLVSEKEEESVLYQFDITTGTSTRLEATMSELQNGPIGCQNVEVDLIPVQEDGNGCCRYIVNVYSSTGQSVDVYLDGQLIASGPALGHSYPIQVCDDDAKTFEVYVNGALCYSKDIKCGNSCCEEVDVIVDHEITPEGCCAYTVLFVDQPYPSFCEFVSYSYYYEKVGDPDVDFKAVDGGIEFAFTICNSGDTVELYVLEGPVPSTVCQYFLFGHNDCIP